MADTARMRLTARVGMIGFMIGLMSGLCVFFRPDITHGAGLETPPASGARGPRVHTSPDIHTQRAFTRPRKQAGAPRPKRNPLTMLKPSRQDTRRAAALQQRILRAYSAARPETPRPQMLDPWRIRIVDGNTFDYEFRRIRIRGVKVPTMVESGGLEASQRLEQLLKDGWVLIIPHTADTSGHVTADVFADGRNLAEVLKQEGYANPRQ